MRAQALQKVLQLVVPAQKKKRDFTILIDCHYVYNQRVHHPPKWTSFALPFKNDLFYVLVTKHLPDFSLFTESVMFQLIFPPLQRNIRFLRHDTPDLQQHALRLACPEGEGAGLPRST